MNLPKSPWNGVAASALFICNITILGQATIISPLVSLNDISDISEFPNPTHVPFPPSILSSANALLQ